MEPTFGQRKLNSILFATMAEMLVGVALSMTDSAIVGQLIGLDALAAISLIMPLTTLSLFLGTLIASGASLAYSNEIGAFRLEKAHCVFGLALIMELVAGMLLFLLAIFALPAYTRHIGVSAEIEKLVDEYMSFYAFYLLLRPLITLISAMVFCDGGETVGALSSVANSVGNVLLSLILGWRFGMKGVSLGTLLSGLMALAILGFHVFGRRSSLRVRFKFSPGSFRFILRAGLNSDMMFLYLTALSALCSRIVTVYFGSEYLPMLTLLYAMVELNVALESAGEAIKPLTAAYLGEKNTPALRSLLHYTLRINLATGAAMSLLILAAAPLIPRIFDLNAIAGLYAVCVKGLRIYAFSCVPMSWLALYDSYWLYLGFHRLSFLSNTLKYFICAVFLVPLFSRFLGPVGLWMGFASASVLSLILVCMTGLGCYGRKRFPDFLDVGSGAEADFSLRLTEKEIMSLRQRAETFLRSNHVETQTVVRVMLAIEELLLLIAEKNPDKPAYAECFLRVEEDKVSMVIWDSGKAFDITDTDMRLLSLRSFVVSSLMTVQRDRIYQLSVGLNRCLIQFSRRENNQA